MIDHYFHKFHIGTYYLQPNARTERHVKELSACGIDFVIGMENDKEILDLFKQYHVGAIVSGVVPGWFGGRGENAGQMATLNPKERYLEGMTAFCDHPAIIGIDVGDEPSGLDFPYYAEILKLVREKLPNKIPYLNLYPSYGISSDSDKMQIDQELGKTTYREYLSEYCENIDLPYLSFDHYLYASNRERFFSDLFEAASACKRYHKKLWVVLQVNSREKDVFIREDQLCDQAFSALAFGVSAITWACYSGGWWYNHVLDAEGNRTKQYEKLKRVNEKLQNLTEAYIDYRWIDTEFLDQESGTSFGPFGSIQSSQKAMLGKFDRADGSKAIYYYPMDCEDADDSLLQFTVDDHKSVYCYTVDGPKEIFSDENDVYTARLRYMEACFIVIK